MSSSPDDKKPAGPLGRGRGRGRMRSISPGIATTFPRPQSGSPKGAGSGGSDEETAGRVSLVRPGSHSPPGKSGLSTAMARMTVLDSSTIRAGDSDEKRGSRRGARPDESVKDDYNLRSRPDSLATKVGTKGTPLNMLTNYFRLKKGPMWQLYGYAVFFEPEEDRRNVRKGLLGSKRDQLGAYIFDGSKMYTSKLIDPALLRFNVEQTQWDGDSHVGTGKFIDITLQKIKEDPVPGDPTYMHFYNLILRKCLHGMGLEELGRHFYNHKAAISLPAQRLVLWPGYVTSLRQHEKDVLLCVETTHKVLRMDTVLAVIRNIQDSARGDPIQAIQTELKDTIVMTSYNRKTYKIADIDFNTNPKSTFDWKGVQTPYHEYYQARYGITITDRNQPMIVCNPSKKDLHKGFTSNVILIPEFCQLTGLTDAMRANFSLMKDLSKHLHMGPADRAKEIIRFMTDLKGKGDLTDELSKWGVEFDSKLAPVTGRVLGRETMMFAKGSEMADDKADWTKAFRSQQMLSTVNMDKWAVVVPTRDAGGVENLSRTMSKVSAPLNMKINNPCEVFKLTDVKPASYVRAVEAMVQKYKDIQMLFVILPNNKLETYAAVKKCLAVEKGVPSQCFVAKNVTSKGLMSIATKVVVQMNAKLGGEPWTIKLPLKNLMVVGFDVYHGAKGQKGGSIGAMVASLSPTLAKYYSTTSVFNNPEDLSRNMQADFTKCCHAYTQANGVLPERVIIFRDGVGEGQLTEVYTIELVQIQAAMKDLYSAIGKDLPKFTFIVVTKKINTRMFADLRGKLENPPPGSIVDDVVTIPDRYDFFLVSCAARQGTVSPCCYNVLYDSQGLDPDKIQLLTFKMCHLYFNWSGTVAVPAPCQYAHKLAFITGTAYGGMANPKLSNLLHFL